MPVYPDAEVSNSAALAFSEPISNQGIEVQSSVTPGLAVDLLGRGVEHLRCLQLSSASAAKGEREAIRILHRLRRQVFEDYARRFRTA